MESGEEPTEITAMTSLETGVSSSDESGAVPLEVGSGRPPVRHRKTLLKTYLRSPQGKCIFIVVLATLMVLASYVLSKLIMGLMFMGSCRLEPFIPIYLVTSALLFVIYIIILIVIIIKCRREEDDDRVSPAHLVTFLYFFVHLVLQLAGSVCVIRARNLVMDITPDEKKSDTASCEDILLSYSFGVVIFELILSGLLLIFAIVSLCEVIYLECCQATTHTTKHPANR